jgi:dihydroneopterin aldolase
MSDCIEIRGLRVLGTHGVLAEELDRPQPFELDLDVWLDMAAPGASDELADTVDYAAVLEAAHQLVATRSYRLLEALAAAVAAGCLAADRRIETVGVTVRKLRPPVPSDVASVGVRVVRHRDGVAPPAHP